MKFWIITCGAQQKFLKVPLYGDHLGDHLQYGQWEVEFEDKTWNIDDLEIT